MWISVRDHNPVTDGIYLIQYVTGEVGAMTYTVEGGWNTLYERNGDLFDSQAIKDGYVVRWYSAPKPPKDIPEEWYREWRDGICR